MFKHVGENSDESRGQHFNIKVYEMKGCLNPTPPTKEVLKCKAIKSERIVAIVTDLSMLKLQFLAYSVLEVCRKNVIFYHILNFFFGGGYLFYYKTLFLIMNY